MTQLYDGPAVSPELALRDIEDTSTALRDEARRKLGVVGDENTASLRDLRKQYALSYYPIIALGLLFMADSFQTYAFTVLSPEISRTLGIGFAAIGGARALQFLSQQVAPLPMAWLSQHKARRAFLCLATGFVWSVITLFTGFVTSALGLVGILVFDGLTTGSVVALHPPLVVDSYPPEARVRALSLYNAAGALGQVASPALVGLLASVAGLTWRGVFLCLGLTSILLTLGAIGLRDPGFGKYDTQQLRASVHEAHGESADVSALSDRDVALGFWEICRRVMLIPTNRRVFAGLAVVGILLIPVTTFISFFLDQRWNLGPGARGFFFSFYAGVGVLALVLYGGRGEKQFRRAPGRVPRAAGTLVGICVVFIALGGVMPAFWPMIACFGLSGAAIGVCLPLLYVTLLSLVPANMRAHAQALAGIFTGIGSLVGVLLLSGIENQYGVTGTMISIAIPGIIGAGVVASAGKLIQPDLDRMIDEVLEDEEIARIKLAGGHLPMLACRGIDFSYGQLQVLFDVNFTVDDGEMVALLGVNGAGKSTLLKVVSGIGLPTAGSVRYRGQEITYLDAERRLRLGITQIPGGRAVFGPMTVVENLRSYGYTLAGDSGAIDRAIETSFEAFPRLYERRNSLASTLSGGEQQMLGLSKALMLRPRLLLIDELSLGLAPVIVGQLLEMVRRINADGTAVVLVEQSVNIALNLVEHAYFMEKGEMRFDGRADELLARDDLLRAVFLQGAGSGDMTALLDPATDSVEGGASPLVGRRRRFLQRARKPLLQFLVFAAVVALAKLLFSILDKHHIVQASTPFPVILLGTITGLTYGLLAVGLVLIYRTNRIINFAHGQIGAFGSAFFGVAAVKWHIPYWVAFPMALGVSAATGAAAETGVVRRLRKAPPLMSIVATLGVGQFLVIFAAVINSTASAGSLYPQPSWLPVFNVGALRVTQAYSGMLFLSPLFIIAIALFLKRSRFGLAMRAAAANPEAARMSGIFASRMSSLAWAIAGALSAFTAILTAPTQGFISGDSFGPELILRAMTAAVIARMQSIPIALGAGIGLGILEQLLLWNYPRSGLVEATLFIVILVTLLLQRQRGGRDEEKGSWAAVQALRPIPQRLRQLPTIRLMGPLATIGVVAFIAVLPLFITNSLSVTFTYILGASVVGLSIGVLTGLGGQLTLGQFAVAAIGAVISYKVSSRIGDFPLALLYAGLGAGLVSMALGLPSLRIRSGVMLGVTTLGFALATPAWLLGQPWMLGDGRDPGRPTGWPFHSPLDTGHKYYYFALVLFVLMLLLALNIRRSGFGRLLVAIRDNEDNARAFGVRASLVKLQGYLVGGFIAGIGGAMYGHSLSSIGVSTFPASASIAVVVMTVLGGVSVLIGPILGAIWVLGLPLLNIGNIGLAATNLGALMVILWKPGGLIQLAAPARDGLVKWIARRHGIDPEPLFAGEDEPDPTSPAPGVSVASLRAEQGDGLASPRPAPSMGTTLLEARHLGKSFGGVHAVRDVSFVVRAGEVVGLIGPNGAGKTTTFEILGGFTRPDTGHVLFDRRDVSYLVPEERARLGLIRSFQDAALFPTMTVKETVMLALEKTRPTGFLTSTLGVTLGERTKERQARTLVSAMGLDRYRDKQIQELSTGTRRITEIACLVALEPVCLLLDEPSSGIAQRETEALGHLLVDLKRELDLTLVIIEHDIPLIMGISDRIIAMADGSIIAEGPPDVVRSDPGVIDAYLGGSITAIERSGAAPADKPAKKATRPRKTTTRTR